jgi:hypothetical protein
MDQMELVVDEPIFRLALTESSRLQSKIRPSAMKAVRAGIAKVMHEQRIYLYGIQVTEDDISGSCLPAVLLGAASLLASIRNNDSEQADFSFDITTDTTEVLTFKISHISASSSRALQSAVVKLLRQTKREDAFFLDDLISEFADFIMEFVPRHADWPCHEDDGKSYTIGMSEVAR